MLSSRLARAPAVSGSATQLLRRVAPAPLPSRRGRSLVAGCVASASGEVKIAIEGMMCDGCTSRVEKVLKGVEGVKAVAVSLESKSATVQMASGASDAKQAASLVDLVNSIGFDAKLSK
ncbi:hypothetical protein HYH03_010419 [Edaphochlamys debaryana]|uniref:HMA domain-containing protein n=1 Tax=Edaphochlamys debaryana TaxID=47281 RepID=A0A835Y542_9CHLO|nr:hypothetical protein HYH03_010419 [Edaphochlamys debaryana]|eukprot:KAG2491209.1 hypothetical protein HYH03_010419 [Edaphochlamys debaryana]